jgi:hypothetical protein
MEIISNNFMGGIIIIIMFLKMYKELFFPKTEKKPSQFSACSQKMFSCISLQKTKRIHNFLKVTLKRDVSSWSQRYHMHVIFILNIIYNLTTLVYSESLRKVSQTRNLKWLLRGVLLLRIIKQPVRFYADMAVLLKIRVFWEVLSCRLGSRYRRFGCWELPGREDEGTVVFQNVGKYQLK